MSKIVRALLISAAATGAFAVELTLVKSRSEKPAPASEERAPESLQVDADRMPEAQRDALLDELAAHL